MKEKKLSARAKEIKFLEESWFHYFNDYLLAYGVISVDEYRKMNVKIIQRCHRNMANNA